MLNTMEVLNQQIIAGLIDFEKAWKYALLNDRERRERVRAPNLVRKRRQLANERAKARFSDDWSDASGGVTRNDFAQRETAGNDLSRRELDGRIISKKVSKEVDGGFPKSPPTYAELLVLANSLRDEHVGRSYSAQGFDYQAKEFATFYTSVSNKTGKVPAPRSHEFQARKWMNDRKHIQESHSVFPVIAPQPQPPARAEENELICEAPEAMPQLDMPPEVIAERIATIAEDPLSDDVKLAETWDGVIDLLSNLEADSEAYKSAGFVTLGKRCYLLDLYQDEATIQVDFEWLRPWVREHGFLLLAGIRRQWPSVRKLLLQSPDSDLDDVDSDLKPQ